MSKYYVLVGHEPQPAALMEWADWFEDAENRRVAQTRWRDEDGEEVAWVSTVFLGLDHGPAAYWPDLDHAPLIFETMAFGGPLDEEQQRYTTWDEAITGHRFMVGVVGAVLGPPTTNEEK